MLNENVGIIARDKQSKTGSSYNKVLSLYDFVPLLFMEPVL